MVSIISRLYTKSALLKRIETFFIPQPGEGIAEIEINNWVVKPGDRVKEFQILCEARSDKGFIEYKSPYEGTVKELLFKESEFACVGDPLFKIDVDEAKYPGHSAAIPFLGLDCKDQPTQRTFNSNYKIIAAPAVRHLAKKNRIDLTQVQSTGKKGRVLKEDFLRHLETLNSNTKPAENLKNTEKQLPQTPDPPIKPQERSAKTYYKSKIAITQPLKVPQLSYSEDIYLDNLIKTKAELQNNLKIKLDYIAFFIKALSIAAADYPIINSSLLENNDEYVLKSSHNIGFSIDSEFKGLTPNIKSVNALSIYNIALEVNRIRENSLKNQLEKEDFEGTTVSICSAEALGKLWISRLTPPQVFIGVVGRAKTVLEQENGIIVQKIVSSTTWLADHRLVDGITAAKFVRKWKSLIENPFSMILYLK